MEVENRSLANLSMREKSVLKRRINREHNSNFRAGYISINEDYLQKTGIRGRKRYFLYCVVFLLILIAVFNALVTAGLFYILKFSRFGLDPFEFVNQNQVVRFLVESTFSSITIIDGELGGRTNSPLKFETELGHLKFKTEKGQLVFDSENIVLDKVNDFKIISSNSGMDRLSTAYPVFHLKNTNRNFQSSIVETARMESLEKFEDFYIETYTYLNISGLTDVRVVSSSKAIDLHPGETISVVSKGGNLILDAADGIFLDTSIPVSQSSQYDSSNPVAYKICVCLSDTQDVGKLFMLEVTQSGISCDNIQPDASICPQ